MTLLSRAARLLPLIPLTASATYLKNTTPVPLRETAGTIGLPYATWLILLVITIAFTAMYVATLVHPSAPTRRGFHEDKKLD